MASFAAYRRTIGAPLRHAFIEFSVVRILVTRNTSQVGEMEGQNLIGPPAQTYFVAV